MKQLNVLGTRRQFFRNPRRIRSFRPGDSTATAIDDSHLMSSNGFPFFPGTSHLIGLQCVCLSVTFICLAACRATLSVT